MDAGSALPPSAETRISTDAGDGAKMIVLSGSHVPPRGLATGASVIGALPATEIFLSLLSAKKAIQPPSGEKNG